MQAITLPPATLAFWSEMGFTSAATDDVAAVEALAGQALPADYKAFLLSYGFVEWDIDVPDTFEYSQQISGQQIIRSEAISHLETPTSLERIMKTARMNDHQRGLPHWPETMFPIGGTPGEDKVLLELGSNLGRIWFWRHSAASWGEGENKTLGFVANSFTDFIQGLQMGED